MGDWEMFAFSIKLIKCFSEIKFLEHKFCVGRYSPDNDNLLWIKQLKRPLTKMDVKSGLGSIDFIPNCAGI